MTYEQALEWLADNVPVDMYDDYNDWYNACRAEIQTPSLWDNPRFNRMHEKFWNDNGVASKNRKEEDYNLDSIEKEIASTNQPVIEQTIITKRSDSNIVEEEQTVYRLPETGRAPEVFARPEPINMQPPPAEKKPSILSRIRRFIGI